MGRPKKKKSELITKLENISEDTLLKIAQLILNDGKVEPSIKIEQEPETAIAQPIKRVKKISQADKKYSGEGQRARVEGIQRGKTMRIISPNNIKSLNSTDGRDIRSLDKDKEIDDKLFPGQVTKRGTRNNIVEIACSRCGNIYDVHSSLIYNDGQGFRYTCDNCIGKGE